MGDFDGDGKSDLAVWRAAEAKWYILLSGGGELYGVQFGISTDVPLVGDFDGDGKSDLAVWRSSNATWYILPSGGEAQYTQQWGVSSDTPLVGDYDGDGKSDLAIWRSSEAKWYILLSGGGDIYGAQWGVTGDIPISNPGIRIPINGQAHASVVLAGSVGVPGRGGAGVTVTLNGTDANGNVVTLTTVSDSNGNYSFTVGSGGSYAVVPFLSGYTFSPLSTSVSEITANQLTILTGSPQSGSLNQNCSDISGTWTDQLYTYTISSSGPGTVTGTDLDLLLPYGNIQWTLSGQTFDGGTYSMRVFNPSPTVTQTGIVADQEDDFTLTNITCTSALATLTNRVYGQGGSSGMGFAGMGNGSSPPVSSTTTFTRTAKQAVPPTTYDITIVGWVDPSQITLPVPQTPALATSLGSRTSCIVTLAYWLLNRRRNLNGQADNDYANAFLLMHSGNSDPGSIINPDILYGSGDFRLFNRLQVTSTGNIANPISVGPAKAAVGGTPDACGTGFRAASEDHPKQWIPFCRSIRPGIRSIG